MTRCAYQYFTDKLTVFLETQGWAVTAKTVKVEPPRDPQHGDMSSNVAMILAKSLGQNPRQIAEQIRVEIQNWDDVQNVNIAGPGFINWNLSHEFWHRQLPRILTQANHYGDSEQGKGQKINIEYVSANPTGPMHVGHTRGAVFGDILASLYQKHGYHVTREYYINDAGSQIDKLMDSVLYRYRQALGDDTASLPEGGYPGDYLIDLGRDLKTTYGESLLTMPLTEQRQILRQASLEAMMTMIKDDLQLVGISHDVFTSEAALTKAGRIEEALKVLDDKNLLYRGVLPPPKGKVAEDYDAKEQLLFRSTDFGDDVDRPLKKSDDSWTYFAPDIAYHFDKIQRGFDKLIDIFGADHGGYVTRIKAACQALNDKVDIDVHLSQMVSLMDGGQPLKMSKRAGRIVSLRDIVEAVGKDAVRFMMLWRKTDSQLDFDLKKVIEKSKDNPLFYIQYAHARICSVFRFVGRDLPTLEVNEDTLKAADFSQLSHDLECAHLKLLCQYPRHLDLALTAGEPHRVAYFLHDVASSFHSLWQAGREENLMRFILTDQPALTLARLALLKATAMILTSGLTIFGITPVEEMRDE